MQSVMKSRQDNDMIDCTGVVYDNNDIKLSWPIGSYVNSDENKIGQLHDWSYRCSLHWKWNWTVMTDPA